MSVRLLRWLLRLAPRAFRERYGEELVGVHRARLGERSLPGRVVFVLAEVAALAVLVIRLRLGTGARDARARAPWWAVLAGDLRFSLRTLARSPGYALAAVSVLALGMGAAGAVYSAADALFLRPLPFPDEGRLVALYETNPEFGWTGATFTHAAPANVLDWREGVEPFQDVAAWADFVDRVTWVRDGEPALLSLATVTGNLFDVLGVAPAHGRSFRWEETWAGADDVVLLGHAFWASAFGADPGVVGRTLEFEGGTVQVLGVMPPGFSFPRPGIDLWTPFGWETAARQEVWFRRAHFVRPVARVKPEYTLEQADAALQVEVARLQRAYPETNRVMGAEFTPLRGFLVRGGRTPVLILLGAAVLLLLLAWVNAANLALVRGVGRAREVAVRHALGASRGRMAALVWTESMALAAGGGLLGLALAWAGLRGAQSLVSLDVGGSPGLALDHRAALFTLMLAALGGLALGVAPALLALRGDVGRGLGEGGRGGSPGRAGGRVTRALVALEVALAVVLVAGAGLMLRTALHLRGADPGFRTDGVLAVQFTVPPARYPERDQVLAFHDRLLEALEARPGVERAGTVGALPLAGPSWSSQFQAEGWPPERVGFEILHRRADRGYFEALGISLVRGRLFQAGDGPDAPPVVVINETFAREHFPGEDPVGQRIAYDRAASESSTWREIVGIVGDQSQEGPAVPARAEVFESRHQDWGRESWVVLRTSLPPAPAASLFRETLAELDPLIAIAEVRPLREVWRDSMAREEVVLVLLGLFGAVALLLAAVGVYGVTAQAARRRTREIGIRMALGAVAGDVQRLVMRQGMGAVAAGLAAGLAATLLAAGALESLLFGVDATDPWTLGAVSMLLLAVGALACWVPARRAARVDPVRSLQVE